MLVGGKRDTLHGDPVPVTGKVRLIHEGSFVREGPMNRGGCRRWGAAWCWRSVVMTVLSAAHRTPGPSQ